MTLSQLESIRAALHSTGKPDGEQRCTHCDDTGDVHDQAGEWRGKCTVCAAPADAPVAEPVALTGELDEVALWAEKMGAIGHPDRAAAAIRELTHQRLQTPDEVAHNLAAMVAEWVDTGIKMGTDWRPGLAGVIAHRLSRAIATRPPAPAAEVAEPVAVDGSGLPEFVYFWRYPWDRKLGGPFDWPISDVAKENGEKHGAELIVCRVIPAGSRPPAPEDAKDAARKVLREVRDWDHRGDSVQERYDEIHGPGAFDAAMAKGESSNG